MRKLLLKISLGFLLTAMSLSVLCALLGDNFETLVKIASITGTLYVGSIGSGAIALISKD